MAGITTLLYYQLYFADAAAGAAAQAANAGDINLDMSPEAALAAYPAGVILQTGVPFFSNCPGQVDLGDPAGSVIVRSQRYVSTAPRSTDVVETVYDTPLHAHVQQVNTVTYLWNGTINFTHMDVHPTVPPGSPGPVTGKFEIQVVSWLGDGTSNRLIPTTFPLDSGVVAIWGVGGTDGVGALETNFFRHNQTTVGIGAMLGTSIMGVNTDPIVGQGFVSFEAGGFRITAGSFVANFGNTTGINYCAAVLRDTTSDNHYLRCGAYIGTATGVLVMNVTQNSGNVTHTGGTAYQKWSGRAVHDVFGGSYIFTYTGPTTGSISPSYNHIPTNPTSMTFDSIGQTIPVPGLASQLTNLWIWGQGVVYGSTDLPATYSVDLLSGASASVPLTTMIQSLGLGSFVVADAAGSNHSVNTFNKQYDYLALSSDAALVAQKMFYSFPGTGAAAPPTVITPLPFDPGLIFARQGNLTAFTAGGFFRAPFHTSSNSCLCANIAGNNGGGVQGINALAALSASFGTNAAPTGQPFYSWMFKGGTLPLNPTFTPDPPPDPGGPPTTPPTPQPPACTVPLLGNLNTSLCAAPAPRFP